VLAVIGQQLLDIGHASESVRVLEAALMVPHAGDDHQRVLACVLSTLAAACWALDRFHPSIVYSLRALAVANAQRNRFLFDFRYYNYAALLLRAVLRIALRLCLSATLHVRHVTQKTECLKSSSLRLYTPIWPDMRHVERRLHLWSTTLS